MSDTAIQVDELSKRYRIGLEEERHDTLVGALSSWVTSPLRRFKRLRRLSHFERNEGDDIIWALREVSFTVQRGEVVGLIGRNGAGKTTLLKILASIVEPTSGRAVINGRVASLLAVGTGFHGELTGRENVYLNGTVLGMSKAEVDRKFDEIVAFSGVEKFIDTPVKRYSSGMNVRLAFAVAAHLDPEILLIDEVLAVGDAEFQKKCLKKMDEIAGAGRTILFVSHSMNSISRLCERVVLLEEGRVAANGEVYPVIDQYLGKEISREEVDLDWHERRHRNAQSLMRRVRLKRDGISASTFITGKGLTVEVECNLSVEESNRLSFGFRIEDNRGNVVFATHSFQSGIYVHGDEGQVLIQARIDSLPLIPGSYAVSLYLLDRMQHTDIDAVERAVVFDVVWGEDKEMQPPRPGWGPVCVPVEYEVKKQVSSCTG